MATVKQRIEYLQQARQGKSNTELAILTGLHHTYISRVFGGTRTPSIEAAILLARALRVDVGTLVLYWEPEPDPKRIRARTQLGTKGMGSHLVRMLEKGAAHV